ncbi:MAG: 4Fe-4S dicluster domain-containing protein [Firmicutes bacterium]|jgi:iron only hydrogenase large subunit-like protein|nr:4Fe-4S dicluster domain-containing protein [Bacillota bacterium]MDH7494952.1 [Fe-Fe] hydrogenase large subunit C-terminal domain-containing protein [Bacillota bacterium]
MTGLFHSVLLIEEKCRGCTRCIKNCPTEAIRVRQGKARINAERCIDCGECIRTCDNHAKTAITDSLERLREFRYTIALPAPALYAQFGPDVDPDRVLAALVDMGFDDVFEVARGADVATFVTREYLRRHRETRPMISAACPAVVRLIQVRFPSLIDHLIPVDSPMACAGKLAKESKTRELGIEPKEIGTFFITPCPAKVTWVREASNRGFNAVDGVVSMTDVYGEIARRLASQTAPPPRRRSSGAGIGWGGTGGENAAVGLENYLVVDGIHSVIRVLEEIEVGRLTDVDFVEAQACIGGCVGGALAVRNPFIAHVHLARLAKKFAGVKAFTAEEEEDLARRAYEGYFDMRQDIAAVPAFRLDHDVSRAISKAEMMERVVKDLPGLDCGSCGSPHCRALAEDIVQGLAVDTDCVFKLRDQVKALAEQLFDLAKKNPSAMSAQREADVGKG